MTRVEIKVSTGSLIVPKRTEITIDRPSELAAVSEAVSLLLVSYGRQIRDAISAVAEAVKIVDQMSKTEDVSDDGDISGP